MLEGVSQLLKVAFRFHWCTHNIIGASEVHICIYIYTCPRESLYPCCACTHGVIIIIDYEEWQADQSDRPIHYHNHDCMQRHVNEFGYLYYFHNTLMYFQSHYTLNKATSYTNVWCTTTTIMFPCL